MELTEFLGQIISTIFSTFATTILSWLFHPFCLIGIAVAAVIFGKKIKDYKKGTYYQITKKPYLSVRQDAGLYGEYRIYKYLKPLEAKGFKFLFNVYVPKENGETSEIDVLMIGPHGIFVFESKNYSGWIFGNEYQKNWYQTLPTGKGHSHKESFYNPIMQNRSHIKHLTTFLGENIPMHSIIVFSERCTLKSIDVKNPDVRVIKRDEVAFVVSSICNQTSDNVLSEQDIDTFYKQLYPCTQVDATIKEQHVAHIRQNLTSPATESTDEPVSASQTTAGTDSLSMPQQEPSLLCPKCGAVLVLRTATKGANAGNQFYGCSNYPKCKYTQNIT